MQKAAASKIKYTVSSYCLSTHKVQQLGIYCTALQVISIFEDFNAASATAQANVYNSIKTLKSCSTFVTQFLNTLYIVTNIK